PARVDLRARIRPDSLYTSRIRDFPHRGEPPMKIILTVASILAAASMPQAQRPPAAPLQAPTVDQILSLNRAGSPEISPDGRWVAYTVRRANWDDNAY